MPYSTVAKRKLSLLDSLINSRNIEKENIKRIEDQNKFAEEHNLMQLVPQPFATWPDEMKILWKLYYE